MRIYLDNCCYNRPYDDQSQIRNKLETQAKLKIQDLIKNQELELASSFTQVYENRKNPYLSRQKAIISFIEDNVISYIRTDKLDTIRTLSKEIMETGIKGKDSYHMACASLSGCKYFVTTDDRVLKYSGDLIQCISPIDFILMWEGRNDEK